MKTKLQSTEFKVQLTMLAFALLFGASLQAQYNYLGTYNSQGKPNYLESISDTVTQSFLNDVDASLPEGKPVPTYNPQYISTNAQTDIWLKDSAAVWVTFVAEGAGYRNVLGFYTYDTASPPQSVNDIANETIIFPNVSASGSGGGLVAGDKVKIGSFSSGTGIGWFLIANGWNGSGVGSGNWKVYSNPDFNPETIASDRFHNVLLNDSSNQRIVLGFEDIRRDYASCDQDFNDAIFYVSANPYAAIVTDSMNTITDASTTVTSGGNGGLESNGKLAAKIALRKFEKKKQKFIDYNDFKSLPPFDETSVLLGDIKSYNRDKSADQKLFELIPTESLFNTTAVVTTPSDLVDITNAKDIFSADYISDENRKGAAMIMFTENRVYEHTKVVCDRLKGAELLGIQKVNINAHPFALFKLKQDNGAIEYAINFVVQEQADGSFTVDNHWTLSQYDTADKNFNFQFWSSSTAMTIQLVKDALQKVEDRGVLNYANQEVELPNVFVKKGAYRLGKLILQIQNNAGVKELLLKGELSRTETSPIEEISQKIRLSGNREEQIEIEVGSLFDIGFSLGASEGITDLLYSADGAWGLDYEKDGARVNDYVVIEDESTEYGYEHDIERGVIAKGTLRNYVSIFKNMKSAGKSIDLSEYNALQFNAKSSQEIEITIVRECIKSWKDQFRLTLPLDASTGLQTVYLEDLNSNLGGELKADDVQMVVFSLKGDGVETKAFEFEVNQLAFVKAERTKMNVSKKIGIYPNPVNQNSMVQLKVEFEGPATLLIRDINNAIVQERSIYLQKGNNQMPLNLKGVSSGIYFCQIQTEQFNENCKFLVR